MKRGQDFSNSVDGIFGGDLDFHGESMMLRNVTNLDASDTGSREVSPGDNPSGSLDRGECGYVVLGDAIGTAQALGKGFSLALPTPERGLHYKFILRAPSIANNAAAAIKIHSTSNGTAGSPLIIGNVRGHGDDNGANVVAVKGVVTFVHNKATAGDMAEIWSDGTNWFLDAVYDADGSITLT